MFGSNALHGAINVVTPTTAEPGKLSLEGGPDDYGAARLSASTNFDEQLLRFDGMGVTTNGYRDAVLKKLFSVAKPKLILTDGPDAATEFKRIFPECPVAGACVEINRQGLANASGLAEAATAIAQSPP